MNPILIAYLLVNVFTLIVYGIDKAAARAQSRRVPERSLMLFGLVGGALGGALVGMLAFRHKTRKFMFWAANIVFLLVQFYLLARLLLPS